MAEVFLSHCSGEASRKKNTLTDNVKQINEKIVIIKESRDNGESEGSLKN